MTVPHPRQSVPAFFNLRKPVLGMAVMFLAMTGGCAGAPEPVAEHKDDGIRRNLAAIVTEDAQATLIGQHILQMGGNAVDATVASAFALSVTMPSRVALTGGGVCLVHDPASKKIDVLDFLPSSFDGSNAGMPAMVRGLYALHARYGALRFEQLIAPAEKLARFDGRVARGLIADLQDVDAKNLPDAAKKWQNKAAGDAITAPDTANLLAQIRHAGAGSFYQGSSLAALADATNIPATTIRNWTPTWRDAVALAHEAGYEQIFTTADAASNPAATVPSLGLVAKGPTEQATACILTRGALFGAGPDIAGFGTAAARAVTPRQITAASMMVNMNVGEIHGAWALGSTRPSTIPSSILIEKIADNRAAALDVIQVPGAEQLSVITCVRDDRGTGRRRCSAAIGASRGGLAGTPK